jgi:hypothetical protein
MTARDTYNASVVSASKMQVTTLSTAQTSFQETINASGCNAGYTLQGGNYGNLAAAVKAANAARLAAVTNAETARQAAVAAARDTLKATGDLGPV